MREAAIVYTFTNVEDLTIQWVDVEVNVVAKFFSKIVRELFNFHLNHHEVMISEYCPKFIVSTIVIFNRIFKWVINYYNDCVIYKAAIRSRRLYVFCSICT